MEPDFRRSDRAVYVGMTGCGKSNLIRYEFLQIQSQRVCIDVNDNESFEDPFKPGERVKPCRTVADVKKAFERQQAIIHVIPPAVDDQKFFDELYRLLFARRAVAIWLDECYGPTTANKTPTNVNLVLTQGRKRDQRHMGATQRPVHVGRNLIAQADHVIVFPRGLTERDLKTIAGDCGTELHELEDFIAHLLENPRKFGEYGYLHYERRRHHWHIRPSSPRAR